jgi:hypothetical protein
VPPVKSPSSATSAEGGVAAAGELSVSTTPHLQAVVRGWATSVLTGSDTVQAVSLGCALDATGTGTEAGRDGAGAGAGPSSVVSPLAPQRWCTPGPDAGTRARLCGDKGFAGPIAATT